MKARSTLLGLVLGFGLLMLTGATPDRAEAQCCAPPPCCTPPPPPCCTPPTPPCCVPPPPPPSQPPCCTPGHNVNIPGVNVFVGATAIVNVSAQASASANASGTGSGNGSGNGSGSGSGSGGGVFFGGGGGGGGFAPPMATGVISLMLEQPRRKKRVSYQATRTVTKRVVIQAVCIDDRTIPHPASQTNPDRDINDDFEGELYRCIAGAWLQGTIAEYDGQIDFSKGKTVVCRKGEALYHGRGGKVECRPQTPGRDCNERSLLRRFGAGVKILTMTIVETYTAYREEEERVETVATTMSLDGGVGGTTY